MIFYFSQIDPAFISIKRVLYFSKQQQCCTFNCFPSETVKKCMLFLGGIRESGGNGKTMVACQKDILILIYFIMVLDHGLDIMPIVRHMINCVTYTFNEVILFHEIICFKKVLCNYKYLRYLIFILYLFQQELSIWKGKSIQVIDIYLIILNFLSKLLVLCIYLFVSDCWK